MRRRDHGSQPIPDGYHSVTPYLIVQGAASAIEFYKKASAASEVMRFDAPGGKIGHAEIQDWGFARDVGG